VHDSISRDMTIAEETRSIAYTLRPLIFPRPLYKEISKVAEISVDLSTKALQLLNINNELKGIAAYNEEDTKFLKYSIENGSFEPTIARVDLTISGNRLLVLEVNADSPGGMRHLDILSAKQSTINREHSSFKWIDGFPYGHLEKYSFRKFGT